MIRRWNGNIAFILRGRIGFCVVVNELTDVTLARAVEIAIVILLPFAPWSVPCEEQRGIALDAKVDHKVDVEACGNGYGRVRPLGNEHTLRIVLVLPFAHLVP